MAQNLIETNSRRLPLIAGGGGLWPMKDLDLDFSNPREMTVTLHEERASITPFGQPELRAAFTPDRIAI